MRVLVTNGDTRPALAVTRSLGRMGHEVIVAAEQHPSLAAASRHCAGHERYLPPQPDSPLFAKAIAGIAERRCIDLVLPITEITTILLAQYRDCLPHYCALPLPATESLRIANDKSRLLTLAQSLGVPVPKTHIVTASADDLPEKAEFDRLVVIKPARSRVKAATGWLSGGVDYASDRRELQQKLANLPSELFPVLLQERITEIGRAHV